MPAALKRALEAPGDAAPLHPWHPDPDKPWIRPGPRQPNQLTAEQLAELRKPLPPGWYPLPDSELERLTPERLQQLTGVHITSCRRWLRQPPPPLVVRLVCVLVAGDLGALHPAWRNWRLCEDGHLSSPEQWNFTPGNVLATVFYKSLNDSLQQKIRRSVQADWIENKWTDPDDTKLTDIQIELKRHANGTQTSALSPAAAAHLGVHERPAGSEAEQQYHRTAWRRRAGEKL